MKLRFGDSESKSSGLRGGMSLASVSGAWDLVQVECSVLGTEDRTESGTGFGYNQAIDRSRLEARLRVGAPRSRVRD